MRQKNPSLFFLSCFILLLLVGSASCTENGKNNDDAEKNLTKDTITNNGEMKSKSPTKVISLVESINRYQKSFQDPERKQASMEYWQKTLKEIKNLTIDYPKPSQEGDGGRFLGQWKLLLDEPKKVVLDPETNQTEVTVSSATLEKKPRRFEGFPSWERLLQDWADDVQEYIEKIEAENSDYPLSTYGRSQKKATDQTQQFEKADLIDKTTPSKNKLSKVEGVGLPVPASAKPGEEVLPHTDISDKSKRIWIVTTAALPWMTGTAVNPLLRAAYMLKGRKEAGGSVTLMLPWLERVSDQERVYGSSRVFASQEDQEQYIRTWLRDTANLKEASDELTIKWYTAWQNKVENSLYSMGDITALIPAEDVDICILEEPEHLNWYRAPGESWTGKFRHVVGIIHTNYFVYAQDQPAALIRAPGMRLLCSWMCRAHCHRVIKLSGTLGRFAPEKELVENVHGVRAGFLRTGEELRNKLTNSPKDVADVFGPDSEPAVYFIGKMLWSKGLGSLMELLKYAEESAGIKIKVDMYGGGPNLEAAKTRAEALGLDMPFHGPIDHAELAFTHKVFINPSTSEVLCTTVAEALAMGKFVVVPSHPSNDFFAQFPNCLTYTNKEEFVGNLYYALTHSPEPLSEEYAHALSWEAATERLEAAGCIPKREAELMQEALASNDARIEISLPSLIGDEEDRQKVADRLRRSRTRYRQFRSRLSQEIQQNQVLPNQLKQRLVSELDKRLDLNIDDVLESPKLRLTLSPAELDKQLLALYNRITDGPSGDVLRVIGGGQEVAFQNLYIKRQATKNRKKMMTENNSAWANSFDFFQQNNNDDTDDDGNRRTASQWVNWALRRNLPSSSSSSSSSSSNNVNGQKTIKNGQKTSSSAPSIEASSSSSSSPNDPAISGDNQNSKKMTMSIWYPKQRIIPMRSVTIPKSVAPSKFCHTPRHSNCLLI